MNCNSISLVKPAMYSSLINTNNTRICYNVCSTSGRTDLMERGRSLKLDQIGLEVLASKIVEDLVDLDVRGHIIKEQCRQLIERHHLHQVVHVARYCCSTQEIISLRLKCLWKYNRLYVLMHLLSNFEEYSNFMTMTRLNIRIVLLVSLPLFFTLFVVCISQILWTCVLLLLSLLITHRLQFIHSFFNFIILIPVEYFYFQESFEVL